MSPNDARSHMEDTLIAVAEADIDIVPALFETFLAAFPEQRAAFTNLEAAMGRMTSETLDALLGLAQDEQWVPVAIVNFVDLHRNYGEIPEGQYFAFVAMLVEALAAAAGPGWSAVQAEAWNRQAARLNAMIAEACGGRTPTMQH